MTRRKTVNGNTCRHCGTKTGGFHFICPECGRPFVRDYIDARLFPRDPNPQGTFGYKIFWARIILVIVLLLLGFMLLLGYGVFR